MSTFVREWSAALLLFAFIAIWVVYQEIIHQWRKQR
jgi:hypothetical protein